ncbi:TPA: hypothetical protein SMI16_002263 [Serratia liquefaciens]|nr:hypothetical protein [Serratia liquefaciens]
MTLTAKQKSILIDTCNVMINRDVTSDYSANLREVAKIALSALTTGSEAQPVAWTSQRSLDTKCKIVAFTDDMSALDYGVANGWKDIVELYTIPPAPKVTGELLEAINEVIRISDRDHDAWNRAKEAIAVCRAAMLAAAPEGGNDPDTRR